MSSKQIENQKLTLVGILNLTPDSFSDGGKYLQVEEALKHAKEMFSAGAEIIDIGGDSTRPGSVCVGAKEEWKRIEAALKEIVKLGSVSVDTHHAEIAEKAIKIGANIINDVSSGSDPQMFKVIADSKAQIILTYSRCIGPHEYGSAKTGDIITNIKNYFTDKCATALMHGVKKEQIILDPGMGAYLSEDQMTSFQLLGRFSELEDIGYPLALGISRKGFVKTDGDSPQNRDLKSAFLATFLLRSDMAKNLKYLRIHNIPLHKQLLDADK